MPSQCGLAYQLQRVEVSGWFSLKKLAFSFLALLSCLLQALFTFNVTWKFVCLFVCLFFVIKVREYCSFVWVDLSGDRAEENGSLASKLSNGSFQATMKTGHKIPGS